MINRFSQYAHGQNAPALGSYAITPSDSADLPEVIRAVTIGGGGALKRIRVVLVSPAGSSIIAPALWYAVRPKPDVRVVIRLVPGKGSLRAVLTIVIAIAAVAIGQMWATAALASGATAATAAAGAALIGMGVNLIGNLLINALVPPVKPDNEKVRNTYAISGWKNRLDPDGAAPFVLGLLRYAPPFAARPYTEIVADWLYVRCIFLFGEGRLNLSDFRIGDTPLSEFDDVQTEIRRGLDSDLPCSLYPQQIVEETVGVDLVRPLQRDDRGEVIKGQPAKKTPVTRTTGSDAKSASIFLAFPGGLIHFGDDGNKHSVIRVIVTQTEATEDICTILRCVDAAPQIDTLTDATAIPDWSSRVGSPIEADLIEPSAPRWTQIATSRINLTVWRVEYLLEPGSGAIRTSRYQVEHRLQGGQLERAFRPGCRWRRCNCRIYPGAGDRDAGGLVTEFQGEKARDE